MRFNAGMGLLLLIGCKESVDPSTEDRSSPLSLSCFAGSDTVEWRLPMEAFRCEVFHKFNVSLSALLVPLPPELVLVQADDVLALFKLEFIIIVVVVDDDELVIRLEFNESVPVVVLVVGVPAGLIPLPLTLGCD